MGKAFGVFAWKPVGGDCAAVTPVDALWQDFAIYSLCGSGAVSPIIVHKRRGELTSDENPLDLPRDFPANWREKHPRFRYGLME